MTTKGAAILQGDYVDLKFIRSRSVCQMVVEFDIAYGEKIVEMFGTPKPERGVPVAIARLNQEGGDATGTKSTIASGERNKPETQPGVSASSPASAPGAKRHFSEMPLSQQAGIRCADKGFRDWLGKIVDDPEIRDSVEAAAYVRRLCHVASRADFDSDHSAGERWRKMDDEFRASQLAEQHGAH